MKRSIHLGLRTLSYTEAFHARFTTFLGVSCPCPTTELSVSESNNHGCSQQNPSFCIDILKQSAELGSIRLGRMMHAHIIFKSEFKDSVEMSNNIVYMYSKCSCVEDAQKLFDEMLFKDTFTWTAMIIAYSQNGNYEKALSLFPKMIYHGVKPNKFSFSSILKASREVSNMKHGMHMHALCIKYGYESSIYVGTSLIDIYVRYDLMNEAEVVFNVLLGKNEVSWNTLIAAHARKDEPDKALNLFQRMKRESFIPDDFTYSSLLTACANGGVFEQGKWIHGHVIKSGMNFAGYVGNALLHMYGKCGSIKDAEKVFTRLPNLTLVSWNSMLTGYAQYGLGRKSVELFEEMLKTRIQPNRITFLSLLTACSHAGLVEEGYHYLNMMKSYGLDPKVDHYVTIVDLLGRAGNFNEALKFITSMPINPVVEIWKTLLNACKLHKNMDLGVYASERVFELDPFDAGPYIILSNIYASAGKKSDVAKVRKMMKENGASKEPACSWVEIENVVHIFVAGDDTHPQIKEIYDTWDKIRLKIEEIGYVPDVNQVLLFVDEFEREVSLQGHSEKLALAFAILNTSPGSTIRIKKNIRVCVDCHSAFKFVSRVIEREIVVRDVKRFHHFSNGSCSCGDYW